jgi:hypothetical protein
VDDREYGRDETVKRVEEVQQLYWTILPLVSKGWVSREGERLGIPNTISKDEE